MKIALYLDQIANCQARIARAEAALAGRGPWSHTAKMTPAQTLAINQQAIQQRRDWIAALNAQEA